MKFLYSLTGANVPVIKEFEIYNDAVIEEGRIVYIDDSGLITDSTSMSPVGISAEAHTGEEDMLNPRSNKNKIRVDITYAGVYEMEPMVLTAVKTGTKTTFVCAEDGLRTGIYGGKLVLEKKAEGSTNTDTIGTVRDVSASTCSDGNCVFTVSNGGVSCSGDVYLFYPAPGISGRLAENNKDFVVSGFVPVSLLVAGYDLIRRKIEVMLCNKKFEN